MRTAIRIESNITDLTASRHGEGAGSRTSGLAGIRSTRNVRRRGRDFRQRLTHSWNRLEPIHIAGGIVRDTGPESAGDNIGTARTRIGDLTAIFDARGPGQSTAPVQSIGHLPATKEEVRSAARVAHELLAFANRQFIYGVGHKSMIAIIGIRTPGNLLIHIEIRRVVSVGVRKSVMSNELQPVARTLFGLDLQGVVLVIGVVAVVAEVGRAASGGWMYVARCVNECITRIVECGNAVQEKVTAIRLREKWFETLFAIKSCRWCCVGSAFVSVSTGTDCGFVRVIRGSQAGENVSSLIADVTGSDVDRRGDLALKGGIPLVDGGKPLNKRTNIGLGRAVESFQRQSAS